MIALEEYEKMQEKKKSQEASKPEERRAAAVDFEGLQLLEKKKIEDDAKLKAENVRKAKEAAAKEAKPRKVVKLTYLFFLQLFSLPTICILNFDAEI